MNARERLRKKIELEDRLKKRGVPIAGTVNPIAAAVQNQKPTTAELKALTAKKKPKGNDATEKPSAPVAQNKKPTTAELKALTVMKPPTVNVGIGNPFAAVAQNKKPTMAELKALVAMRQPKGYVGTGNPFAAAVQNQMPKMEELMALTAMNQPKGNVSTGNPIGPVKIQMPATEELKALTAKKKPKGNVGTVNPIGPVKIQMPTMAEWDALTAMKKPAANVGTVNPIASVKIKKPTMEDWKALTAKKEPTVYINVDEMPIQDLVTVNPTLVTTKKKAEARRSNAKDRKTMLYETNDGLLTNNEILEKYQYVMNDPLMDSETRNKAAKKGLLLMSKIRTDERINYAKGNRDLTKKANALQKDLNSMTKQRAFEIGVYDALGFTKLGELSDNYWNKHGSQEMKAEIAKSKAREDNTRKTFPGYVKAGNVTGTLAVLAALNGTAGVAAETAVVGGAKALGKRMLSATAPDAVQQLAALIKYNPNIAKGVVFGTKMLGQQAADTAVNTPFVIANGIAVGKDKKQIASDVAKQQATDFGFNLGFGALQAAGKALKATKAANRDLRNIQNATSADGKKSMQEARNILEDIQTDAPQNSTILRANRAVNAPMGENIPSDSVVSIGGIKVRKEDLHDVNAMRLASSTQERNMESLISNPEVAKRMNQEFIEPIHSAEQRRQFFIKDTSDKIKKLNIDTKKRYQIKDANRQTHELTESGLVQYLGEKRHQLQMLKKTGKEGGQNLKRINNLKFEISLAENALPKEQLKKINKDIQVFQEIDKSMHEKVNEVLIRNGHNPIRYKEGSLSGIFFNDATDPMRKELQKLGIDFPFLTENSFKKTSLKTEYNVLKKMDQYLENMGTLIYHTDDINNLRKMTDEFEYAYSPDWIKAKADAIKMNHLLSNKEKWDMLDGLYEPDRQNHPLREYLKNIRTYTDTELIGKKHPMDRTFEKYKIGSRISKAFSAIEDRVGANMTDGNIGSAITYVTPITQGMSAMSKSSNLKGLMEALQYMAGDGMDDITKKSAFLSTREGRKMIYNTKVQKAKNIAIVPSQFIDKFSTQAVYRSRFYDNLAKGMKENSAISEADDYCRRVFGGRSKGAMPTIFHSDNPLIKPLTMYSFQANNQLQFILKDLPKEAHGSAIKGVEIYVGACLGAYAFNDMYEKLTGQRAALDPIGIANQAIKDFTGTGLRNTVDITGDLLKGNGLQVTEESEKKNDQEATVALLRNIGGNAPFGSDILGGKHIPLSTLPSNLLAIGGAVGDAVKGDGSWGKAGNVTRENLSQPFYESVLPFGGDQLRKTVGGLSTMVRGGGYTNTDTGEHLQFAVDQSDPLKWAKAGIFGQEALSEAQEYLKGQTKAFDEKQTSTYEKLKDKGIVNMQAYGAIRKVMQARSPEEKRKALRLAMMNQEGKAIIYYDLLANQKDRGVMDALNGMGEDDYASYDCVEQLADNKADNRKRNIILHSKLSEESKKYVYREKVTKDDEERIDNFSQAGMNMDEFLMVKNYLYAAKERSLPSVQKRELFVNWVLEKGYSKAQREVIYDSFNIAKNYRR